MQTIHDFIKARKSLIWWVPNYDQLDAEAIVEATLNHGNWDDVQDLIKILGLEKTAQIFRLKSQPSAIGRQNYSIKTKAFFTRFFDKYAPRDINPRTS